MAELASEAVHRPHARRFAKNLLQPRVFSDKRSDECPRRQRKERLHEASADESAGTVALATRTAQRVKLGYERGDFRGVEETFYVANDRATRYLAMCHASYLSCGHGPGSFRCAGPLFLRICRTKSKEGTGRCPSVRRLFYPAKSTEQGNQRPGGNAVPPSIFSVPSCSRVSGEVAPAGFEPATAGLVNRSSLRTEVRGHLEGGRWLGRPHPFQGTRNARFQVRCRTADRNVELGPAQRLELISLALAIEEWATASRTSLDIASGVVKTIGGDSAIVASLSAASAPVVGLRPVADPTVGNPVSRHLFVHTRCASRKVLSTPRADDAHGLRPYNQPLAFRQTLLGGLDETSAVPREARRSPQRIRVQNDGSPPTHPRSE